MSVGQESGRAVGHSELETIRCRKQRPLGPTVGLVVVDHGEAIRACGKDSSIGAQHGWPNLRDGTGQTHLGKAREWQALGGGPIRMLVVIELRPQEVLRVYG